MLTDHLSSQLSRIVLDDGSFPGRYDVWLRYAADTASPSADNTEEALPGIFTALHEQLGLKIEAEKAPVDVLVIDHIDAPDPD